MSKKILVSLALWLTAGMAVADEVDIVCFFPSHVDFDKVNKTCKKGDLIRTRPYLAEMVCDWDKQIFKYTEEGEEWVTCVYHGKPRQLKQNDE